MPRVSVIIPAYNAERFLPETLASVWAQTETDLEVILVNDGSRDGTDQLAAAQSDPRFHYLKKANSGVSDTRNQGLQRAIAPYLVFLDADDLIAPQFLRTCADYLDRHPEVGMVYVQYVPFESDTGAEQPAATFVPGDELRQLLEFRGNAGHPPSTVLFRRAVLDTAGGFDPRLSTSADWDMWVRMGQAAPMGYVAQPLVRYRLHSGQMHRNIALMRGDMLYAFAKARKLGVFRSAGDYRRCLANLHLVLAGSWYHDARKPLQAVRHTLQSLCTHPGPLWRKLWKRG
ncbi:MAG: glycosyltransferase [Bacteroidetes bacterium]|nr:glycosyltransferase [Bacteroidota bacterium]